MNEEIRKEFERWIIESNTTGRVPNFIMKNENCAYIDPQTSNLWIAWQASREAMKPIKLPDTSKYRVGVEYGDGLSNGRNNAILQCSEILQQAGYKVE